MKLNLAKLVVEEKKGPKHWSEYIAFHAWPEPTYYFCNECEGKIQTAPMLPFGHKIDCSFEPPVSEEEWNFPKDR